MPPTKRTMKPGLRPRRPGGSRYALKRRPCPFCVEKNKVIDYKDVAGLRRFVSDRARIEPRRRSGACARHQRAIAEAIKRARFLGLLPYTPAHLRLFGGPAASAA